MAMKTLSLRNPRDTLNLWNALDIFIDSSSNRRNRSQPSRVFAAIFAGLADNDVLAGHVHGLSDSEAVSADASGTCSSSRSGRSDPLAIASTRPRPTSTVSSSADLPESQHHQQAHYGMGYMILLVSVSPEPQVFLGTAEMISRTALHPFIIWMLSLMR